MRGLALRWASSRLRSGEESRSELRAKQSVRGVGDYSWRCLRAAVCLGLKRKSWEEPELAIELSLPQVSGQGGP